MTGREAAVLGYLHKWCRGVLAARPQAMIARHLQTLGLVQMQARDVREAVAALSLEGWPVGTSPAGCFLCIEGRDFRAAYRNLYGRLREQAKRCRVFKATAREYLAGQRRFDFSPALTRLEDLGERPLLALGRVDAPPQAVAAGPHIEGSDNVYGRKTRQGAARAGAHGVPAGTGRTD